jgi:hypothetical protein
MEIEINKDDILDYFDDGKSILLSYRNIYKEIKISTQVKIEENKHSIGNVCFVKNRILLNIS